MILKWPYPVFLSNCSMASGCLGYRLDNVHRTITVCVCDKYIYLFHPAGHYDLVGSTVKVPKNICNDALNLMPTK